MIMFLVWNSAWANQKDSDHIPGCILQGVETFFIISNAYETFKFFYDVILNSIFKILKNE
jgi:hypothetical protein